MPAHVKRAGGTNESDSAYRTSEFHARSAADGGDLFAVQGRGLNVDGMGVMEVFSRNYQRPLPHRECITSHSTSQTCPLKAFRAPLVFFRR